MRYEYAHLETTEHAGGTSFHHYPHTKLGMNQEDFSPYLLIVGLARLLCLKCMRTSYGERVLRNTLRKLFGHLPVVPTENG